MPDANHFHHARVRLTKDGCIRLLWPVGNYTGRVEDMWQVAGQTRLIIRFDKPTPSGQKTGEVPEHEAELV